MPAPPKLAPHQWDEIARRRMLGESSRALGREFGVNEASIRDRLGTQASQASQTSQVRSTARKLAGAQQALEALPPAHRPVALQLADQLRNTSTSLAAAAEASAATAHRLAAAANAEAQRIDDAAPLADPEPLRAVVALTSAANAAATIPLGLLAANSRGHLQGAQPAAGAAPVPDWRALLGEQTEREPPPAQRGWTAEQIEEVKRRILFGG